MLSFGYQVCSLMMRKCVERLFLSKAVMHLSNFAESVLIYVGINSKNVEPKLSELP